MGRSKIFRGAFVMLLIVATSIVLPAQNGEILSGTILDAQTKEPLPYSTVFLKKQSIGTLTSEAGRFSLLIPPAMVEDSLLVVSLGYKDFSAKLDTGRSSWIIEMEPSISELKEIVVRPLPPTYYISRAMRGVEDIRPKEAFQTEGYYFEKISENKKPLKYDEGIFRSFIPKYKDTLRRQYQLLLYRQASNIQPMQFMAEERKKFEEKEKRKSKEANKPVKTGIDFIFMSGGPPVMLHYASINRRADDYLDSTEFKHYDYSFASSGNAGDAHLLVIDFKSKGVVNNVRKEGKIFIHLPSNAILKIEGHGEFVIPIFMRPLMFLYGFSAQDLTFEGRKEYQMMNGKWYFKNSTISAHVRVTKKHFFSPNEHAEFDAFQSYSILKITEHPLTQIPAAKRYNPDKRMGDQVFPEPGIQWSDWGPVK
jgi:hypothetical protein